MTSAVPNQPIDANVREAALDPSRSFAVSAPAGSGKTGLLTQRVLRLLQTCDHPEELLAITFTRKAAGEMRDRITSALNNARTKPCPESPHEAKTWQFARAVLQRDEDLGWQLINSPNRLRIQTIDGLSRQLAKQLPFESGMGSLPDPSDQPEPLYRAAVLALFNKLETDAAIADDIATILRELDNRYETFESLLVSLLKQRDQWLGLTLAVQHEDARGYLEGSLKALIIKELKSILNVFSVYELSFCELARYAAANLLAEDKVSALCELADLTQLPSETAFDGDLNTALAQYQALLELLLKKDGDWRVRLDKNMGFPTERSPDINKKQATDWKQRLSQLIATLSEQPQLLVRLQNLRALPQPNYQENQWQLLDALTRLLPYLAAELTLVFSREGCSDFIDTSQAALTALGNFDEPSELALKLDYQVRHILIDEFQDTAVPQRRLIELLTAGWESGDGRTLFIVGDGMQSCYGFRNAKVGIFLQAREHGIGTIDLQPLDLQVNFRSQQGLVDWVNCHFAAAFPDSDDITRGNVRYHPSVAAKPLLNNTAARLTLIASADEDGAVDLNQAEADEIVALIKKLQIEDNNQSIAILARTRSHLRLILRGLDLTGVRYQATELDNLSNRMAIQDLQSLLRLLQDPTDRISWLSLLRSPCCGLDNADLLALANSPATLVMADGRATLWSQLQNPAALSRLSAAGKALVERTVATLRQTLNYRGRKPLRDWLEGCWLALGGRDSLLEASDIANCQSFFDLLEAHTEGPRVRDWQAFEEAIARLFAAPASDADPRLQVMTIHKSKGLEFDQVIIPGLHRMPRADSKELLLWLDQIDDNGDQQILLSPLSNFEQSDLYSYIQAEKTARTRAEATRLFYVGATRAVRQLHLFACAKQKNGELQPPPASSLLACMWDSVKDSASVRFCEATLDAHINSALAPTKLRGTNYIRRLPCDWQFSEPDACELLAAYRGVGQNHENDTNDAVEALNRPDPQNFHEADNRAIGTLLHRQIQMITESGQLPDTQRLQQLQPLWAMELKRTGVTDNAAALRKIHSALVTMATSTTGRWLLDNTHSHSATELQLWAPGNKGPNGQSTSKMWIVDRTFVDAGVRWVVDYKSAQPRVDQSVEEFADEQLAQHRKQLARYAKLVAQLGPEPVKTALYFPLCDHFAVAAVE